MRTNKARGPWTLEDRLFGSHVWKVSRNRDQFGVLKEVRNGNKSANRRRFADEVKGLESLKGTPGVLPLIDRDRGKKPRWFVMPVAEPLAGYFADNGVFEDIVSAFSSLADTLSLLSSREGPVAHRDIKPDNLFWFNGRPVLGDFGIAAWPDSAQVTRDLEKVGPLAFLAPEALRFTRTTNWHAADVYSLAKSMWSIAAPREYSEDAARTVVAFPPQGQISKDDYATSLRKFGGHAAQDLDYLMHEATSNKPSDRPSAAEFGEELRSWLRLHPGPGDLPAARSKSGTFGVFDELAVRLRRYNDAQEDFLNLLVRELRASFGRIDFKEAIEIDNHTRSEKDEFGVLASAAIMFHHGRGIDDEWDGALVVSLTSARKGVRVVAGGVFRSPTEVNLVSEVHGLGANGQWEAHFVRDIDNLHPGRPTGKERLRDLVVGLVEETGSSISATEVWTCTRVL